MVDDLGSGAIAIDRRRFMAGAVSLGAGLAGLAGAKPANAADAALIEAAKREGAGMVYLTDNPSTSKRIADGFAAKYGIAIESQRLTGGPFAQRFIAEAETGTVTADLLITPDIVFMRDMKARGWLAQVDALDTGAPIPDGLWDGRSGIVAYAPQGLGWNTEIVKAKPTSWKILIDPEWKGRVLMYDMRTRSVPALQWVSTLRAEFGDEFIRELGRSVTLSPSAAPGMQQVAAGAMALYAPALMDHVAPLKASGAPVDIAFLEPAPAQARRAAVPTGAPHPNVGRLLLAYLMSPEGQGVYNEGQFSPLPEIPGTLPLPRLMPSDPEEVSKEIPELLGLLNLA